MTSGDSTEPRIFTNQTLRLHELADEDGYITNVLVQDCEILGPAVLLWSTINFTECGFHGSRESIIWPIPANRRTVTGALMLRSSSFENCQFTGVGLAVPEAEIVNLFPA